MEDGGVYMCAVIFLMSALHCTPWDLIPAPPQGWHKAGQLLETPRMLVVKTVWVYVWVFGSTTASKEMSWHISVIVKYLSSIKTSIALLTRDTTVYLNLRNYEKSKLKLTRSFLPVVSQLPTALNKCTHWLACHKLVTQSSEDWVWYFVSQLIALISYKALKKLCRRSFIQWFWDYWWNIIEISLRDQCCLQCHEHLYLSHCVPFSNINQQGIFHWGISKEYDIRTQWFQYRIL